MQSWHGRNKSLWYCRDKISIYVLGVFFSNSQKNVHPRLCDNLFNYSASFVFSINFENTVPLMITDLRRVCGFQNLVRTSEYGEYNLSQTSGAPVAAKTLWGPVLMPPCPQAHLNTVFLIITVSLINNHSRYFWPS